MPGGIPDGKAESMAAMTRPKKWRKWRHRLARTVLAGVMGPASRILFGCRPEPFRPADRRGYLILFNHQTVFDQFFIGLSFRDPVYFVSTEDLFSMGIVSSVIRFFVAPIPFMKQTSDIAALRTCMQVAREGGNVAVAPEGNMTYSGKTEYMRKSIASLAKALNLPVALYRIEGGYGIQPRWGRKLRRGKMRAYVSRVIEPEEYANYTADELYAVIRDGLTVNECRDDGQRYRSRRRAEHLERAAYFCPRCGLASFESKGSRITCGACGITVEYGEDKRLRGVNCDFPYEWFSEWYDAQKAFILALDPERHLETPLFRDQADLYDVDVCRKKKRLRKAADVALYGDRIVIGEGGANALTLPFRDMSAASLQILNKLNLCMDDGTVYQLRGGTRFNAMKYINLCYRFQQMTGRNREPDYLGF